MMRQSSVLGVDLALLAATVFLMVTGVLFIYSSGVATSGESASREYVKQIVWVVTGLGLLIALALTNYGRLAPMAFPIYFGCLAALVFTLALGKVVNGARSWLGVGDLGVQPSEFTKLATILALSSFLSSAGRRIRELPRLLLGLGIVLAPMGLILLQPDMGTALVYIPIFLAMALVAGARLDHLGFLAGAGLLTVVLSVLPSYEHTLVERPRSNIDAVLSWGHMGIFVAALLVVVAAAAAGYLFSKRRYFYWIGWAAAVFAAGLLGSFAARSVLKEYQLMRLIIFLDPAVDPRGAGWNIIQSVTAIGSGGFFGKGFLHGTQSRFNYLPQQSTDFIFSILAEEWGFVGAFLVLAAFLVIVLRGVRILSYARDEFALYAGTGIVAMILFHVLVNVGMTMGIMPITGIPLPFLSQGGSALWTMCMGVGILLNVYLRRYRY
jgi:rod shape determining protein RodA